MQEDDTPKARGIAMNDTEIEETLIDVGFGTLSLASDGEAYGVPISFGYTEDRIFMNLLRFGDSSKKLEFQEKTEIACLTASEVHSRFDWKCVIVTGPLRSVDESEREFMEATLEDNAWSPSLFPPTGPMEEVRHLELEVDKASGRKGQKYQ